MTDLASFGLSGHGLSVTGGTAPSAMRRRRVSLPARADIPGRALTGQVPATRWCFTSIAGGNTVLKSGRQGGAIVSQAQAEERSETQHHLIFGDGPGHPLIAGA